MSRIIFFVIESIGTIEHCVSISLCLDECIGIVVNCCKDFFFELFSCVCSLFEIVDPCVHLSLFASVYYPDGVVFVVVGYFGVFDIVEEVYISVVEFAFELFGNAVDSIVGD